MIKPSCWLVSDSSGSWFAANLASYYLGRMNMANFSQWEALPSHRSPCMWSLCSRAPKLARNGVTKLEAQSGLFPPFFIIWVLIHEAAMMVEAQLPFTDIELKRIPCRPSKFLPQILSFFNDKKPSSQHFLFGLPFSFWLFQCTVRFGNCFLRVPLMHKPCCLVPCCQGNSGELPKNLVYQTDDTVHFVV